MMLIVGNLLLGLSLAAPIGPVNMEMMRAGMSGGFRSAFLTGLGAVSADTVYLFLFFWGLGPMLSHQGIRVFLWGFGSLVLLSLGAMALRDSFHLKIRNETGALLMGRARFSRGFLLAISSPMNLVWWAGIFGAAMAGRGASSPAWTALPDYMAIPLGCLLWVVCFAAALNFVRRLVTQALLRFITFLAGFFLCGMGFWFLYQLAKNFF
jgi:threonine/homoserine/homoserine lactone efflux protein